MKRTTIIYALAISAVLAASGFAQELKPITLPRPQMEGGKTVMQALAERKTTREFSDQALSPQMLSNLLWAAFGVIAHGRAQDMVIHFSAVDVQFVVAERIDVGHGPVRLPRQSKLSP